MADVNKILWVEGLDGPIPFPIIGETPTTWKAPALLGIRTIKKNPYTHFEDWGKCFEACKESAEARLIYAQRALEREQRHWENTINAQRPEGA